MRFLFFKREQPLVYRGRFFLRALGALLLTVSAGMVVLGNTVWADALAGMRYITYWSWCFAITIAALLVALCDLVLIRRAGQQTRRQLLAEQFLSEDFLRTIRGKNRPAEDPPQKQ